MSLLKVFVLELLPVDRLSPSSISAGEVSSLNHKVRDDAMELRSLEMQWLARLSHSFLACAKAAEIFGCFWNNVGIKLEINKFKKLFFFHLKTCITMRPAALPPMVISKNTFGRLIVASNYHCRRLNDLEHWKRNKELKDI